MTPVPSRSRFVLPYRVALLLLVLAAGACPEQERPAPQPTRLKAATDVFWALNDAGWVVSKEEPHPSRHGCRSAEYLAKQGGALFSISLFHCGDAARAAELAGHKYYRHVDALLRNRQEGGILQRGPILIIVRRQQGEAADTVRLLEFLGKL